MSDSHSPGDLLANVLLLAINRFYFRRYIEIIINIYFEWIRIIV